MAAFFLEAYFAVSFFVFGIAGLSCLGAGGIINAESATACFVVAFGSLISAFLVEFLRYYKKNHKGN